MLFCAGLVFICGRSFARTRSSCVFSAVGVRLSG